MLLAEINAVILVESAKALSADSSIINKVIKLETRLSCNASRKIINGRAVRDRSRRASSC